MAAPVAASFRREMSCTEGDWLRWLPAALAPHVWQANGQRICITLHAGHLELRWTQVEPWRVALVQMPRLVVDFEFVGVSGEHRAAFMQRFDLYLQRGGG